MEKIFFLIKAFRSSFAEKYIFIAVIFYIFDLHRYMVSIIQKTMENGAAYMRRERAIWVRNCSSNMGAQKHVTLKMIYFYLHSAETKIIILNSLFKAFSGVL